MSAIPEEQWRAVGKLYLSGLPMREVANHLKVSIDAVTYVLRKNNVSRRSLREASRLAFEAKAPSFTVKKSSSREEKDLEFAGALLYWAEGYKTEKAHGLDFANSDPDMALLFMRFLRSRYLLDRCRLYCQVYYYEDQNIQQITSFWSRKLHMPTSSFRYPYMKNNPKQNVKKLPYGVIHIRYNDKKLLRDVLHLIELTKRTYTALRCAGGRVVNCT